LDSVHFEEDAEGTRYNILLALQEMVSNVLRHGYRREQARPIEVVYEVTDESLQIVLRDQGPEFDPLQHDTKDVEEADGMPAECGGFGIHIARVVMDKLEYTREDGWNALRLSKWLRAIPIT
jgi:anti-sigma regulatory factor (Ser/Thr protein kinase)